MVYIKHNIILPLFCFYIFPKFCVFPYIFGIISFLMCVLQSVGLTCCMLGNPHRHEQLIISYAEVHNLTNPKIAWSDMKNCENLYCMHSKDVHFNISFRILQCGSKSLHSPWIEGDGRFKITTTRLNNKK
jgi:hypothetical protein